MSNNVIRLPQKLRDVSKPRENPELGGKIDAILDTLRLVKGNVAYLAGADFKPIMECSPWGEDHSVHYLKQFPALAASAKVKILFSTQSSLPISGRKHCEEFERQCAMLTSEGVLLWWAEKVICLLIRKEIFRTEENPSGEEIQRFDVVYDVDIVPLNRSSLEYYLNLFPKLSAELLSNLE